MNKQLTTEQMAESARFNIVTYRTEVSEVDDRLYGIAEVLERYPDGSIKRYVMHPYISRDSGKVARKINQLNATSSKSRGQGPVHENPPMPEHRFETLVQQWRDIEANLRNTNPTTAPDLSDEAFARTRGRESAYEQALHLVEECPPQLASVFEKVRDIEMWLSAARAHAEGQRNGYEEDEVEYLEFQGACEAYAELLAELSRQFPRPLRINDRRTYGLVEPQVPPQETSWYCC